MTIRLYRFNILTRIRDDSKINISNRFLRVDNLAWVGEASIYEESIIVQILIDM